MKPVETSMLETILAIDIGATTIKFCHVDAGGELLGSIRRKATPYPCRPARLVELLAQRIIASQSRWVGVGFPGEFSDGHVIRPGNLSRPGGVMTERDPGLEREWRGFALQEALCAATGRDVRVVNDARLAALGCCGAEGVELVLTLGTGLGLSLSVDGVVRTTRDVGAEAAKGGLTYDQLLGERARSLDEAAWSKDVVRTVAGFSEEFDATTVHLAGGNARRVSPGIFSALACRVIIEGNQAPLRGAAKLFYS